MKRLLSLLSNQILFIALALNLSLVSCGNKRTGALNPDSDSAETKITQVFPPIGLYYGMPTAIFGNTHDYEIEPSNLPDYVTYPNDLAKTGLRGKVKSVRESVSTFSWTYTFNPEGNLTDYQFRMDSQGRYGEGAKAEYNEAGELTLLGRNFRGQSANSHKYIYKAGKLSRRSSSRGERLYYYHDSMGVLVPDSVVTKGLTPYLDIKFKQHDDIILVERISYKHPSLPSGLTAQNAESILEYATDGSIKAFRTVYRGVKGYKTNTLYGLTEYSYNEQGDVTKKEYYLFTDKAPLTDATLLSTAVHHGIDTFEYQYDKQGNWVTLTMNSEPKPKNTVAINTMSRTVEYYSDKELQAIAQEKKEAEEKPFIGTWAFHNTEDMGDGNKYNYQGTIVLNLYEKFMPEGGEAPQWGIVYSGFSNTLGANRNGSYNITEFKISGNTIKINLVEIFYGTEYTAILKYDPTDKSMTMSDVTETDSGDEEMINVVEEPQSEKYSFQQRATSPK